MSQSGGRLDHTSNASTTGFHGIPSRRREIDGMLGSNSSYPIQVIRSDWNRTVVTAIAVLLRTVRDVVASHNTVIRLFEHVHTFLQRLNCYIGITLTNEMMVLFGEIMAQLLSLLALSTKAMTDCRIKKVLKRLIGRADAEDALLRLDSLTTVARNLEVTCHVDGNVTTVTEVIHDVDNNVVAANEIIQDVDGNVGATKKVICDVNNNVKATKELVDIHVTAIKGLTNVVGENMEAIKRVARNIDDNVKATRKSTGQPKWCQSREKLRAWLCPPNSSINHNTACETQHSGTASWFIRGDTFQQWKKNGSLLWMRGNLGAGKSILCSAVIEDIKSMQNPKPLIAYHYFDFRDTSKRDVRGLLASLLFQLGDGSDRYWDVLYRLYTTCGDGSEQPNGAALANCLKTMLELPRHVPIFVIMDALDECPNTTGTPSPAKRFWTLWRILSGRIIRICSFASLAALSKTYRMFLTP
ncbi:hypothetical protein BJV74DRAFT_166914 [Russula compacta]|nr:hypothetical protein BJV74DRAFT_166914 [Russula compacta]